MEYRTRQLPVGLMQGVQGHDLHRKRGRSKLRAAKKINQSRSLGQGEARKIGGNHIQQGRKTREKAAHGLAVVIAPGNGKFAHHKGCHGRNKKKTGHAHLLGKSKEALLHAAVKPLQQPALGRKQQEGKQGLHKERVAVVEKFAPVGTGLVWCKAKMQGNPSLAPVTARYQPIPESRGPKHEVLLCKKGVDVQPVSPEHGPKQAHGKQ